MQTYPVPAGFCSDDPSFLMGLAANTWDRYSHANNILIQFELDTTGDGNVDYLVYNFDASLSGQLSDGRSPVSYTHLDVYKRQAKWGTIAL